MPMLDVYIPDGALRQEAEAALVNRITEILIRHEGFDPADPVTRSVSWVFVHRPAAVYVGGALAEAPRYKVVPSVPEGQLDEEKRAGVVADVTEAILDAENGAWPRDPGRIWVFPTEIPEGHWGGYGQIRPLAAILARLTGHDDERARALATQRIATSRAEHTRLP
ncbi:phenylpyruvate tautomerase PptA (4-oxalocrotonate tautomerase family) [Streptosporangium becharense]|uniref:Phenylpyruvate tautomerase PptA (4-oxalocrotonate tautomerase family) n=1 Tax=Streptosporangium becharense TaxID=1816182 RepID=A0A7W9IB22_9ACTN|nr:Tautomerase enzyme [Streptosporangium becharense]MBB2914223.1 phenylpyruvate tautomerase PptA (4-oxalocrotonate tautomerase family) [Streptosporangium becharense]MBB5817250.1 phenylpyruvate tautomerase PptA (4-oxalocrotonate tautomerase family) [Streptosporangium becharense]